MEVVAALVPKAHQSIQHTTWRRNHMVLIELLRLLVILTGDESEGTGLPLAGPVAFPTG